MIEIKMPRLGVTMQNGTVSEWLVEEGNFVEKGDLLFELETEKSMLQIEAQESGFLKKIVVPSGKEVPVNTVIAVIGNENEEIDLSLYYEEDKAKAETAAAVKLETKEETRMAEGPSGTNAGKVSPRARRLAKELGVTIENVVGTGKDGIITEDDIRSFAKSENTDMVKERIALNNVKRAMAENMLNSWRNIPQFTQMVSVNMENALKVKKELGNVSINDILIKSVGNALKDNSMVNSRFEDQQIIVFKDINISVAVTSKNGLVVPVVKNVETKSVFEISQEIRSLAEKAENNKLTVDDFANGTITVSNLGSLGIENGTPIINPPQSSLVFAGAIKKTPVVNEEGDIFVAPIMTLSISYDHRFIDGVTGAQFTNDVKHALEKLEISDLF
ncbi:dihydrolipoamide acetyltransferase family protein [Neobacillus sp. SAB-20_R2A]|uniref:dihydrolipoamide acetyltransferase family protein n=1 Tax=Neobacillus sp. SAB-20_R2A TaxID=3120519 RepID=UPI003C6E66CB